MARLTGKSIAELKEDLPAAALDFAKRFHTICVLKDARTVVASPEGRVYINTSGCSALATAGSGDVLAGILASLLVQQNHAPHPQPADRTAAAAVFLHGLLGELAASQRNEASVLMRRPDPNPYFQPTVPGTGNFGTPQRLLKPSDGTSRPCRYTSEKKREYLSQTIKIGE